MGGGGCCCCSSVVKEFDGASVPGSLNLGRFTGRLKIQVFREFPDLKVWGGLVSGVD